MCLSLREKHSEFLSLVFIAIFLLIQLKSVINGNFRINIILLKPNNEFY
jgi:hypothetical protein